MAQGIQTIELEANYARQAMPVEVRLADAEPAVELMDFRKPSVLLPGEWKKLRLQHEGLMVRLSARLSRHFQSPCQLVLEGVRAVACGELSRCWNAPSQLSIFKIESLRGVALLQISQPLGASLLNRLMGGGGKVAEAHGAREMTDVERALFEQTSRIILEEWCAMWPDSPLLKPQILAVESDGRFLEVAGSDVMMLAVSAGFSSGEMNGELHLAMPLYALKSLIKGKHPGTNGNGARLEKNSPVHQQALASTSASGQLKHAFFDDLPVTVSAEWANVELNAQQVLALAPGAVLRLEGSQAAQVAIKLGDQTRFLGRPGTQLGSWAVELTRVVKD